MGISAGLRRDLVVVADLERRYDVPMELSGEDLASLIEGACKRYEAVYHRGSLPTVAAKVLFAMLATDVRASGFPVATQKIDTAGLEKGVRDDPEISKKTAYAPSSFR